MFLDIEKELLPLFLVSSVTALEERNFEADMSIESVFESAVFDGIGWHRVKLPFGGNACGKLNGNADEAIKLAILEVFVFLAFSVHLVLQPEARNHRGGVLVL